MSLKNDGYAVLFKNSLSGKEVYYSIYISKYVCFLYYTMNQFTFRCFAIEFVLLFVGMYHQSDKTKRKIPATMCVCVLLFALINFYESEQDPLT